MRILIGYDGSKNSGIILEDLKNCGLPEKTEATVLSVADVFLPGGGGLSGVPGYLRPRAESLRKAALRQVEHARLLAKTASKKIADDLPGWKTHAQARGDSPAWAILKKSWEWKPDLIFVGSAGRGAYGRLAGFGGVCQRIVNEAKCNVRVARRKAQSTEKRPPRILVGIDGSRHAELAWREASRRKWPHGAEIRLLAAFQGDRVEKTRARKNLERIARRIREKGPAVSWDVRKGDAAGILLDEAKRWKADCIFLGARGLNPVRRFFVGSVSSTVAAKAACSVEIVKK